MATTSTGTVAQAAALQASPAVTAFTVTDTAANIGGAAFDTLNGYSKLTGIAASDGKPIAITYTQFTADTLAVGALVSGTQVAVSAVPVANAATLQASTKVKSFDVADTPANILASLASLSADTKLSSITLIGSTSIAVTYSQYQSYSATLDKLVSADSMTVSAATASGAAALQADAHVSSFTVSDTSAHIASAISALNADTKLSSIAVSVGTVLGLTAAQYSGNTTAVRKLTAADMVSVSGVTVATASSIQTATNTNSFSITDTAANIVAALPALAGYTKLTGIAISGGTTLPVTYTQYTTYTALWAMLTAGNTLVVSGAAVANAAALQSAAPVSAFSVTDTTANILAGLSSLASDKKLSSLSLSDATTLAVAYSQYASYTSTLDKLAAGNTMIVSAATAAAAGALQADTHVGAFAVSDTAANIASAIGTLNTSTKATSIALSSGSVLTIAYAQYTADTAAIALLASGTTLAVTGAKIANAAALQSAGNVVSFTIADTSANVLAALATLASYGKLTSFSLSDTSVLTLTYTQYTTYSATLAKLAAADTISVTAVAAANAAAMQAVANIGSYAIADTAANILLSLPTIGGSKLASLTLTGSTVLAVTYTQYQSFTATLDKLVSGNTMTVSAATAAGAAALQADVKVSGFAIADTSANIAAAFAALSTDTKLTSIAVTGGTTLSIAYAQYTANTALLAKLASGTTLSVTAAPIASAAALQSAATVSGFTISDTSTNLLANLTALGADTKLTAVALTDTNVLSVSATTYFANTALLDKLAAGDTLSVTGATVAQAAALQADTHVSAFTVIDTMSNVTQSATALAADSKLASYVGVGPATTVSYATYQANSAALDSVAGAGSLIVTGVTAAGAATVAADAHVQSVTVSDSLANIGINLGSLQTLLTAKRLTGVAVSDSGQNLAVTAAQSIADAGVLAMMTGNFTVTRPVINLIWDASVASAPVGFVQAIQDAANYLDALIASPITVNIQIGYGEYNGAAIPSGVAAETQILNTVVMTASQYSTYLGALPATPVLTSAIASLSTSGVPTTLTIASGEAKALGATAYGTAVDAAVGFEADAGNMYMYNPANRTVLGQIDLIGLAEHELTHALGRLDLAGQRTALDAFRFSAPGTIAAPGTASYFSVDGGKTNLNNFATTGDSADWASSAGYDANDAILPTGYENAFSATDVTELQALGFTIAPNAPAGTAVIAASAAGGLNASTLTFIGTPQYLAFGGTTTAATVAIPPAQGIESISGFTYGTDTLTVNLAGLSGALQAFDTTVGTVHAIALAGANDLTHGIVLTGMAAANTAANLMSSHLTIVGTTATIN